MHTRQHTRQRRVAKWGGRRRAVAVPSGPTVGACGRSACGVGRRRLERLSVAGAEEERGRGVSDSDPGGGRGIPGKHRRTESSSDN